MRHIHTHVNKYIYIQEGAGWCDFWLKSLRHVYVTLDFEVQVTLSYMGHQESSAIQKVTRQVGMLRWLLNKFVEKIFIDQAVLAGSLEICRKSICETLWTAFHKFYPGLLRQRRQLYGAGGSFHLHAHQTILRLGLGLGLGPSLNYSEASCWVLVFAFVAHLLVSSIKTLLNALRAAVLSVICDVEKNTFLSIWRHWKVFIALFAFNFADVGIDLEPHLSIL